MAQPTAYDRQYDFSDYQTDNPSDPLPGDQVDIEFDAVKLTLDEIRVNLALIQRDDGALSNAAVTMDSFSSSALALIAGASWLPRGAWLTATAYAVHDMVSEAGVTYVSLAAHTSGVFATDLAADKWLAVATTLYDPATTSQAGVAELATDAEAIAKAATDKVLVASNLAALGSSSTFAGLIRLATTAETLAKAEGQAAVRPSALASMGATDTFAGFVEKATDAEAAAGVDTDRYITPASLAAKGYVLAGVQVFTSTGTYTRSSGVRAAVAEVVGGGAGGGYADSDVGEAAMGAGGGAGGYSCKFIAAVGATEAVTIGAAGAGGVAGTATPATNGGTSSFGVHCSATGGSLGSAASSGTGVAFIVGGVSGIGSGGDVNGGGESGGHGLRATLSTAMGGKGGSLAPFGKGGAAVPQGNAGVAATGRGAGGGGGANQNNGNANGAAGSAGLVVVWEYR